MRLVKLKLPLVMVAVLVAAGCVSVPSEDVDPAALLTTPEGIEAYALERLVQDHAHEAEHAAHAGIAGFEHAAFLPARDGAYPAGETYFEIAVKGGFAYLTFGPKSGFLRPNVEAGFIVYDLSDPSAPQEVGRWLGQPLGDIEVSDDGNWVFASTQRNGYPYPWTINPSAGAPAHLPRGTFLVDVSDKANPTTRAFSPLPTNGPHTITYYQMPDGRELLLQATYDFLFTVYPDNLGQNKLSQKVVISEFVREGEASTLRPLSVFQRLDPDSETREHFPHDMTVHVDPATQRVIMDIAYWDLGLVLVDITDPSKPKELAQFADTGPSLYTRTHLVRVFPGTIDGRTVAVLEPEIPSGDDAGQYTFVDVSDPEDPVKLGHWALPGGHVVDLPFVFSPHNFDLVCGGDGQVTGKPVDYAKPCENPTVVLSHFHGGVWSLDASDPSQPKATGFFFPEVEREVDAGFPFTGFATVFVYEGYAYAPEAWTGLHVLKVPAAAP